MVRRAQLSGRGTMAAQTFRRSDHGGAQPPPSSPLFTASTHSRRSPGILRGDGEHSPRAPPDSVRSCSPKSVRSNSSPTGRRARLASGEARQAAMEAKARAAWEEEQREAAAQRMHAELITAQARCVAQVVALEAERARER